MPIVLVCCHLVMWAPDGDYMCQMSTHYTDMAHWGHHAPLAAVHKCIREVMPAELAIKAQLQEIHKCPPPPTTRTHCKR